MVKRATLHPAAHTNMKNFRGHGQLQSERTLQKVMHGTDILTMPIRILWRPDRPTANPMKIRTIRVENLLQTFPSEEKACKIEGHQNRQSRRSRRRVQRQLTLHAPYITFASPACRQLAGH